MNKEILTYKKTTIDPSRAFVIMDDAYVILCLQSSVVNVYVRLHRRKCNPETLTSLIRYTIHSKPKHLSQIFRWLHVNLIMKFAEARIQFVILIEKRNYENLNGNLPISEQQWTIWEFCFSICTTWLCFINWCYSKVFYYYWYVKIDTLNLLIALIKSPIDPTDINGQKTFFSKI